MSTRRFNQLIQHKTASFSLHQTVGGKILKSKKTNGDILYLTAAFFCAKQPHSQLRRQLPLHRGATRTTTQLLYFTNLSLFRQCFLLPHVSVNDVLLQKAGRNLLSLLLKFQMLTPYKLSVLSMQ